MPKFITNTIQFHAAAKNPKNDDYLFLVLQRALNVDIYPGHWQVITGFVEENETSVEAALRELFEETVLKPIKMWTVPYLTSFFDSKNDNINFSPVFGCLVNHTDGIILSEEHRDFKWLGFEKCMEILELPSHKAAHVLFRDFILNNENDDMFKIKI